MIHKKPQPAKIGAKLWAIFDPTEDNGVSQRAFSTFSAER